MLSCIITKVKIKTTKVICFCQKPQMVTVNIKPTSMKSARRYLKCFVSDLKQFRYIT